MKEISEMTELSSQEQIVLYQSQLIEKDEMLKSSNLKVEELLHKIYHRGFEYEDLNNQFN